MLNGKVNVISVGVGIQLLKKLNTLQPNKYGIKLSLNWIQGFQTRWPEIKIEIFKKYNLDDVIQAHKDLEARKILGPAIIVPN